VKAEFRTSGKRSGQSDKPKKKAGGRERLVGTPAKKTKKGKKKDRGKFSKAERIFDLLAAFQTPWQQQRGK